MAAIFAGDVRAVLIAGAEATGAMKAALKRGMALAWARPGSGDVEDRASTPPLLSRYEIANGLGAPTLTYPAFEHALRARWGLSREAHLRLMSELWAGMSEVAAANRHAQFPHARSPAFLAAATADNYPVADPYLKWHVAQDAVNQGAAVILTSVGTASALGVDPAKWVFLHGYAEAADATPTARPDLSRSRALEAVLAQALAAAGKTIDEIAHLDLYSCFPCAVLLAAEALGLDWRARPVTVTGGLPFFGGAGNSYSLHAIATMTEHLRADSDAFGLVLANGGFLSKAAAAVYSAQPPRDWQPCSSAALQRAIDVEPGPPLLAESADATVETYTVGYSKGAPARGYVIARAPQGRILARVSPEDAPALLARDPIGRTVRITHANGINWLSGA